MLTDHHFDLKKFKLFQLGTGAIVLIVVFAFVAFVLFVLALICCQQRIEKVKNTLYFLLCFYYCILYVVYNRSTNKNLML